MTLESHKQEHLWRVTQTSPLGADWTVEESKKLYRLSEWGDPYFEINAAGHVTVSPQGDRGGSLDLWELVNALQQRNIELPVLIRFSDILADRLERLHRCFDQAIARYSYPGAYRGVFPIKCNQHRHLVETLVRVGQPYQFGLEAGSKPELMIALASLEPTSNQPEAEQALLICNGYKDREYLETALLATKLGQPVIIVIEQLEELRLIVQLARQLAVEPVLGVRAKLSTTGTGRWGNSTGDRAKFGLSIPQILAAIHQLQAADMTHCLQLLHFHLGSQISSISAIKDAIREASQIYGELVQLGAKMQYLDVGGGLAVDYDGSKTNCAASKNYNMQNYANDIVAEVKEACEERQIPVPVLISESGRAIASHQSVLIFDVLSTDDVPCPPPPSVVHQEHLIIRNLWETYRSIGSDTYQEAYHDAIQFKEEAISLFSFGYLSLTERARAEQLYWACCRKILAISQRQEYVPDDLAALEKTMMSLYSVNLSIFQSVPDTWAIEQLFPVMPIHRLDEKPCRRGILADLTCDSDGQIDRFIDSKKAKPVLELHPLREEARDDRLVKPNREPYYLGMFLVGAYQEVLGSLHNLFGDTNVVHVQMNTEGYQIEHLVRGDTITEVLSYVQYDAEDLLETMRRRTETALQNQRLTLCESQKLLRNYERSLRSYTYLTS
ncbi:MAG: biosynthetic arginine decarboxylase [Cyanophyceae cyanobacterium]